MKDAHASGKFDATAGQWQARLHRLRDGHVLAVTEALAMPTPDGWERHGRHESDILWRAPWTLVDEGVEPIPTPTWNRGRRRMTTVDIRWVLLRHPAGWTLLRATAHIPKHLKRAHRVALARLVPTLHSLRDRTGADETTFSADFNDNLRSVRLRRQLERTGLAFVVSPTPTHGRRVIDGFLTTLHGEAKTLTPDPGFDHDVTVAGLFRD